VAFGKIALGKLTPLFQAVDVDNIGCFMLMSVVLSAIGADGTLTALERSYLRDVVDLDDETIDKFITLYDSKMVDLTDHLFDHIPNELKAHLMTFVLTILAVDEKISREETAFVHRLFE